MNKFNIGEVKKKIARTKVELPVRLAKLTENHFTESFSAGALDEYKWAEVNRRKAWTNAYKYPKNKGLSRRKNPILVMSGNLRRKVSRSIHEAKFSRVRLVVDLPYAQIHNEGGVIHKSASTAVVHMRAKTYALTGSVKQSVFSTKKDATHAQKVNIAAHDITIPARPFMKQTNTLASMQKNEITKYMDKVWQ